jgi:hypothetical protein
MTAFRRGGPLPPGVANDLRALDCGVAYGGGLCERAASQSKGMEEEIEAVEAGER